MTVEPLTRPSIGTLEVVFGAAVLAEVGYPLTSGSARDAVTVATVLLVAAGVHLHAWTRYGARTAAVLAATTVAGGFAVETIGVHTGFPFGSYRYTGGLGPSAFGVPLVIAFAWPMLAWPAALAARRLCRGPVARVVVGAWALAAWDVFLDPQMVDAGHWRWADPHPHLPGVPGVPVSNYLGWFAVAVLVSLALQTALRWPRGCRRPRPAGVLRVDVGVLDARAGGVPRPGGRCLLGRASNGPRRGATDDGRCGAEAGPGRSRARRTRGGARRRQRPAAADPTTGAGARAHLRARAGA